jgi:hypothetical protein
LVTLRVVMLWSALSHYGGAGHHGALSVGRFILCRLGRGRDDIKW